MDVARGHRLFDPARTDPYALSRSKLALFLDCPRCFVLDRRYGVSRPDSAPFTLNLAVDQLLKREFDGYRLRGEPHPSMRLFGIDGVPLRHRSLEEWRDMNHGVQVLHAATNIVVYGAIDDAWLMNDGSVAVVDYKATGVQRTPTLDDPNRSGYKRQIEVYQWLLRGQGIAVSPVGYLYFVSAVQDRESFDQRLEFRTTILPYEGSDAWIDPALREAKDALLAHALPPPVAGCPWCAYRRGANAV